MVGFQQTDIGLIPMDWEVSLIGKQCQIFGRIGFRGYTVNDIVKENQGAISLSPSNIVNGELNLTKVTYLSWFKYEESPEIKIYNGDILLVKTGSTYGKTTLVNNLNRKATLNPQIVVLKNILCNNLFLGYLMKFPIVQNQIESTIVGGAIPTLSQVQVSKFKIPLPPLPEQGAIAQVLSDTDALITVLEKRIAKKRLIKQGAMQKLLTPQDDWEVKKLGDFLEYEQPTKYLVADTKYNDNYDTPVLTAGKTFILGRTNEKTGIYNNLPVIIFDDFTTASKFVEFPFKVKSSAMKILKPKNKYVNMRLVFEIMQRIDFPLGGHKRHWIGEFQHLEIQVPDENEQTRIATILSDMDRETNALEKKLSKTKELKQGLMQQLLTGKIRLV